MQADIPRSDRLIPWLYRVAFAWMVAAVLYSALHIELGYDPAYHATLAKNWVQGYGWATSYDSRFLFNPDVTTGPAMLLPAAALIALFGNAIWVPALCAAILHLLLFGLILRRVGPLLPQPAAARSWGLCLGLAWLIYANTWWVTLTADFLVALCLILAFVLLVTPSPGRESRRLFAGGLVLGYALLAKVLAWFGLVGLLAYALLRAWHARDVRQGLRPALLVLGGILLLTLPWKLYETLSLRQMDTAQRSERAQYKSEFFVAQGSGIRELQEAASVPQLLRDNLSRNTRLFAAHYWQRYNLPTPVLALLVLGLFAFTLRRACRSETPLQQLQLLLGLTASAQLIWYLLLSASWNAKYVLAPVLIGLCMLTLGVAQAGRAAWLATVLALSVLWLPAAARGQLLDVLTFRVQTSDYTRDMLATRDHLLQQPAATPLAGCGWVFAPWELEYLLPGVQNFSDCRRLIAQGLAPDGAGGYRWVRPVEFRLVLNHVFWNVSAYRERYAAILGACLPTPLLRTDYFTVAQCTPAALAEKLPLDPSSEFRPSLQPRAFVHKPLPLR